MKKIMSIALGLTLLLGIATSTFAEEKKTKASKASKTKKTKGKKTADKKM